MLNPTPPERLCDAAGHPYFLWDCDLTLQQLRSLVSSPDPDVRAYHVARLLRQAKPDDVFSFVTLGAIRELWPRMERYLGQSRPFWTWLLARLDSDGPDGG